MARVLLAADAEPVSNRVVTRLALEEAGHTVHEVHDGFEALAVADVIRPDALVLDTALARPFTNADLGVAVGEALGGAAREGPPPEGGRTVAEWGGLLADALRDRHP